MPDGLSSPNGEGKGNDEAAPLLVGVELDRARGDSDGSTPDGRRLFECKPNYGLFVRVDKLAVRDHLARVSTRVDGVGKYLTRCMM